MSVQDMSVQDMSVQDMSVQDMIHDAHLQNDQAPHELDMERVDQGLDLIDMSAVDMITPDEDVPASCSDGVLNGAEDEVDCGGECDPCEEPVSGECLEDNGGCGPSAYVSCSVDEQQQLICTPLVNLIDYPQASDSFADRHFKVLIIMVNTLGEIPETSEANASGLQEYYSAEELGAAYFELPTGVRSFIREASYEKVDLYSEIAQVYPHTLWMPSLAHESQGPYHE